MPAQPEVTVEQVLDAARKVRKPFLGKEWVARNRLREIKIRAGNVTFDLWFGRASPKVRDCIEQAFRSAVQSIPGVTSVRVQCQYEEADPLAGPDAGPMNSPAEAGVAGSFLPGVRHVIAVSSGKGGVGKSTIAVNFAVALARAGYGVGLLDADIYGPSIPALMGVHDSPAVREVEGRRLIVPIERYWVRTMSLGFLLPPDAPPVI